MRQLVAMRALSIRQPWAWLIVHGHKDIENRSWRTNVRGRVLVHAASTMGKKEYEECRGVAGHVPGFPSYEELLPQMGGVVGSVEIVGCVMDDPSYWFFGRYGFKLERPQVLPFRAYKGRQGFFQIGLDPERPQLVVA